MDNTYKILNVQKILDIILPLGIFTIRNIHTIEQIYMCQWCRKIWGKRHVHYCLNVNYGRTLLWETIHQWTECGLSLCYWHRKIFLINRWVKRAIYKCLLFISAFFLFCFFLRMSSGNRKKARRLLKLVSPGWKAEGWGRAHSLWWFFFLVCLQYFCT